MNTAYSGTTASVESSHGPLIYGSRGLSFTRGSGARLTDSNGKQYTDCGSMIGVTSLGHGHPEIAAAVSAQAERLLACFGSFGNDVRSRLYEALVRIVPGSERFFLCSSGTEANEAALKFACRATGRHKAAYLNGSFHGRTVGALSLTSRQKHREMFAGLLPGMTILPFQDEGNLEDLIDDDTAAVFVEVIQGEGGVRVLDPGYLQAIERACRKHGALLVVDEVQTGFCRTGSWFAFEQTGIRPDMVCMAKAMGSGVPVGCVAMGPRVSGLAMGVHGSTFGGNPLAASAALATIDVMERDNLAERAARLGKIAVERLIAAELPIIREVRGRGLMLGIDLRKRATEFVKQLQKSGIIVLTAGPTVIRLLPPLIIDETEWLEALDSIIEVLSS